MYEVALRNLIAYKWSPERIINFWDNKEKPRPLVGENEVIAEWILDGMSVRDLEEIVNIIKEEN